MKQLKLDIETLDIQSFSTERPIQGVRGTVRANNNTTDPGCTSFGECGGPGGSFQCNTYGFDCTWYPELQCYSNPIAFPTEPNCDQNCGVTYTCP